MIEQNILLIILSSIPIGFLHTLFGPDHYIPFIALAKARRWSLVRTIVITTICGIGHVLSAALLAFVGIGIGVAITQIKFIEAIRGDVASWFLIIFGLVYFVWSLRAIARKKHHEHFHLFEHHHGHSHVHTHKFKNVKELTPWVLFIIFVLGPCEPLIPLIMYPAIQGSKLAVFLVALFFGLTTIATMLGMVVLSVFGMRSVKINFFEKYGNAIAGAIICSTGVVIKYFGL